MISYEIGVEQNLYDKANLDFTMYYKDAKNLRTEKFLQIGITEKLSSKSKKKWLPAEPVKKAHGKILRSLVSLLDNQPENIIDTECLMMEIIPSLLMLAENSEELLKTFL